MKRQNKTRGKKHDLEEHEKEYIRFYHDKKTPLEICRELKRGFAKVIDFLREEKLKQFYRQEPRRGKEYVMERNGFFYESAMENWLIG